MVHSLIRHFHPWCARISASNIWRSNLCRRTCHSSMGVVYRLLHGHGHSFIRSVDTSQCIDSATIYLPFFLVAELVSAYPTAGGMYFVTKHVVPKEHVAIWAWIIGWCNFLGQAAGVASLAYTIAQMIFAAVVMNSPQVDGEVSFAPYVPSPAFIHS